MGPYSLGCLSVETSGEERIEGRKALSAVAVPLARAWKESS